MEEDTDTLHDWLDREVPRPIAGARLFADTKSRQETAIVKSVDPWDAHALGFEHVKVVFEEPPKT